jgi:hypothetical protein
VRRGSSGCEKSGLDQVLVAQALLPVRFSLPLLLPAL